MERVLDGPPSQADDAPSGQEQPTIVPTREEGPFARGLVTVRPLIFAAAVGLAVLGIQLVGIAAEFNPYSGRVQYGLRSAPLVVAALAGGAMWWARKRGWTWDADLIPALFGGLGALTLLTALHGTPFDMYGLIGDQLFRTEYVTRFADSWWGGDYTYRDLPAYYAPAFFWVLGRAADLTGTAPWHMLKFGTVAVAFAAPIVSYLLWRRVVSPRVAAVISAAALIVPSLSESYAWIVLFSFIPWWLMAGHGLHRPGARRWHPVVLGLIGAVLFTTYYYYFFLLPIAFCVHLADARLSGRFSWRDTSRTLVVLGVAALGSAVYWAPLAWNFLTASHFESLNNRWITLNSGKLALPMLEPTVIGALCLVGLVFLLATVKEALSRAMLIVLVSLYVWHAVGFLFLALDKPLMSFRMRELVPVLLLAAAAMAVARVARYAADNFSVDVVWRFAVVGTVLLAVFTGNRFVELVLADAKNAHNQSLPNGQLPPFHEAGAEPWKAAPPEQLHKVIDAGYKGPGRPVVLTSHPDLLALYPYYGFVQWSANYSHPTSQFHPRLEFLEEIAKASGPAEFAARLRDNPYDRIDVLALDSNRDTMTLKIRDDAFPFGTKVRQIDFPRRLVQPEQFDITTVDTTVVAVLKRG
ncbi:arabinofuranosyltransferase [Phytohabitans suffuscus]|uniref:Galactan 5-O-arabinofuranosyltransferase n=1 Tax=Phytohabitans suffuscus TaxID=624315 RepID=A0A6F8YDX4_9ACTN|nr:arabinofuranosyltransferase [Phytohabitans suffuscus]BCB84178.1 arabinofuranosyltransferase AftA [Phytohabitans suffuscus]